MFLATAGEPNDPSFHRASHRPRPELGPLCASPCFHTGHRFLPRLGTVPADSPPKTPPTKVASVGHRFVSQGDKSWRWPHPGRSGPHSHRRHRCLCLPAPPPCTWPSASSSFASWFKQLPEPQPSHLRSGSRKEEMQRVGVLFHLEGASPKVPPDTCTHVGQNSHMATPSCQEDSGMRFWEGIWLDPDKQGPQPPARLLPTQHRARTGAGMSPIGSPPQTQQQPLPGGLGRAPPPSPPLTHGPTLSGTETAAGPNDWGRRQVLHGLCRGTRGRWPVGPTVFSTPAAGSGYRPPSGHTVWPV